MFVQDFRLKMTSLSNDPADYEMYLADPDTIDGPQVDVELVPVVKVDWDAEAKTLRLYPERDDSNHDSLVTAADVLAEIPVEVEDIPDAILAVEMPIVRTQTDNSVAGFGDVHDMIVGEKSLEIWLLVKPRREYRDEDLPL